MTTRKLYRCTLSQRLDDEGVEIITQHAYLSQCGEWVELGDTRWRRTPEWCETQAEAKATLAGEIARIGTRIIAQSSRLYARERCA